MRSEYQPHPEEVAFFRTYSTELREDFQNGLLKELTPYRQFVVWSYKLVDGTFKKPPFNPKTHHPAAVDTPKSWGTIHQALGALATGYFHGIGFVLSKDDPFTGIDLDHCVEKNGDIAPWAKDIITNLNTYTEYSPGNGVHLFVEGMLPEKGRKFDKVEMYSANHYLTITTRHLAGTPTAIENRQEAITALYRRFAPAEQATMRQNTGGVVERGSTLDLPPEAKNDQVLDQLLQGISLYGNTSTDEYVALMKLLHYTGDDRVWTKGIFSSSPIGQRAKAREDTREGRRGTSTYLENTIDAVLRKRRNPPMRR